MSVDHSKLNVNHMIKLYFTELTQQYKNYNYNYIDQSN